MDRHDRLENKIDQIVDRLGRVDTTLAAQHASIKEHIRRTELLEHRVAPLEKKIWMIAGAIALVATLVEVSGHFLR